MSATDWHVEDADGRVEPIAPRMIDTAIRECPVLDGCHSTHPWHGHNECQEDIGRPTGDPQDVVQCPCVGACPDCGGWGSAEYAGREHACRTCKGSGRAS